MPQVYTMTLTLGGEPEVASLEQPDGTRRDVLVSARKKPRGGEKQIEIRLQAMADVAVRRDQGRA